MRADDRSERLDEVERRARTHRVGQVREDVDPFGRVRVRDRDVQSVAILGPVGDNFGAGMTGGEISHHETKDMAPVGGKRLAAILADMIAADTVRG